LADVAAATFFCWIRRVPMVAVCRGTELRDWDNHRLIRRIVSRTVLRRARLVLLKELHMERTVLQHRLSDKERLMQIHNAVPSSITVHDKFDRHSKTFIFLNSFRRMRNVDVVVEAFNIVCNQVPAARLRLIGSTAASVSYSPAPGEYEAEIAAKSGQTGKSNISIEPFSTTAWETVDQALCFLLPADVVWLNYALLEAMAFGLPAIVSNTDGVSRIVSHDDNGLICEVDAESLAEQMLYMLANPDKAAKMSRNAKNTIRKHFAVSPVSDRIYAAYDSRVWRA